MTETLEGLNLVELLDLLEPIPEPPPVSMWPQTPGWIVVGLIVAVALVLGVRTFVRHRRANAYRKAAMAELQVAQADAAQIADILRRTALAGFPRVRVAGLTGEAWIDFLDRTMGGTGFRDGPGSLLVSAPYRQTEPSPELAELARKWIQTHKVEAA